MALLRRWPDSYPISSLDDFLYIFRKDGVLAHQLSPQSSGLHWCDVTVDEMFYLTEVIDDLLADDP